MGAKLGALPKATVFQRTDLLHGMFVGLIAGGLPGAALGYVLYLYPALGESLGMGPILALTGAVFGSWASGMIAISIPNSRLKQFQKTIEKGAILLMADVPKERVEEITDMIKKHHPEADDKGSRHTCPRFRKALEDQLTQPLSPFRATGTHYSCAWIKRFTFNGH